MSLLWETFTYQSSAYCLEAYLEQSSPAPPPCTPTILHEFSAGSAVLWGEEVKKRNKDINHLHLEFQLERKSENNTVLACLEALQMKHRVVVLFFLHFSSLSSFQGALLKLLCKRARQIVSPETALKQISFRLEIPPLIFVQLLTLRYTLTHTQTDIHFLVM